MTPEERIAAAYDEKIAEGMLANPGFPGLPDYLGLRFSEAGPGRLCAEMDVRAELLTPFGSMHGGVLAALCDHLLGCVCYPHMERGRWAATTEFKLNYLAAVTEGCIRAEATLVALTRATAVVRIEVRNDERIACIAQGTVLIRESKAARR